jgi:uroporphyrinogen III methyltransferase / synthase
MTVYLVGAGPGDPGLVTLRGRELLERCDVVVYDALADERVVGMAAPRAERIDAGKRAGAHAMSQQEINRLLVDLGRRHGCVVRLKGGDPFVFGRGGEEALALTEAGVPFEVVPGVSSAHAVPAYAGIPVTHRGMAAQVTFVTGHEDPSRGESSIDWGSLAATPGTLVFLMGVRTLERNAARLIEHGMSAATPAAVIAHGTQPAQRTVVAPLGQIAVRAAGLGAPAVVLVGEVASLHDRLAWFERRPLFGRRVAVTRARTQASALAAQLEELGAQVMQAPAIRIEPLDIPELDLPAYQLVCLTSRNGVERLISGDVRRLAGVRVAAVGTATAASLRERGIEPDILPDDATQEGLLAAVGEVRGQRALVATAEGARDVLAAGLRAGGADVTVVHLYRTVAEPVDAVAVLSCDLVSFTSSSTVANVLAGLPEADRSRLRAVSIGPVTSSALRAAGVQPLAEANPHNVDGLVQCILGVAREGSPGAG